VNPEKENIESAQLTGFLKYWAKKLGAKDVGITLLKDYHKYATIGRGDDYGKPVQLDHKYAIAITVEMDKDLIDTAPKAPVTLETSHIYLESGEVAVQIAVFLRKLGFESRAHIDGNYRVICPLVAKDAGLGNIGRMGLLMTPKEGPRVRIAVVTTDAPLKIDNREPDHSMTAFCRVCKKCAENCPSRAIPFDDEKVIDGVKRWQINQEKCFTYWCQVGTDCGKCIAVCPYSHPDNLFHNIVRFGTRHNPFFRLIAASLDDVFYGKKVKSKKWSF
jgi:reductive dehalogenase